ncbi:helix-turn-helix domain-containing protein [Halobacteriales archaeon QH_7_66_36]|nr:MAG: helix-turn-helix domain-containing protein [Halobacteriales archaeon QH_7_66_36]
MPRARLTVTLPRDSWLGRVTRTHQSAQLRIRTAALGDPATLVATVAAPDVLPAVVATAADAEKVTAFDVLDREGDRAVCRVTTQAAESLHVAVAAGTPPEFPFTVVAGTARWSVVASNDALSALADEFDEAGIEFEVETVTAGVDAADPLTPRQRRVTRVAVERGYYETPRDCSLAELATALDLAKSTVSETLRRAERRLLAEYLDADGETP